MPDSVNYELRGKWITALRSGKYQQTQTRLRRGDEYCCLGVLCDMKDPYAWHKYGELYAYDTHEYNLPSSLRREVGLNLEDMRYLIGLNDGDLQPFSKIADSLEHKIFPNADKRETPTSG